MPTGTKDVADGISSDKARGLLESSAAHPTAKDQGQLEPLRGERGTTGITLNAVPEPVQDSERGYHANGKRSAPHRLNRWVSKPPTSLKVGEQLQLTGTL